MHPFHGVAAEGRVGGMTGLALEFQALHHDALVHAHRFQAGWLADDRVAGLGLASFGQGPGAIHGALFVGGGQYDQGLLEILVHKGPGCFNGQREKAFHVAGTQPVPAIVPLGQGKGVALPTFVIKGHRIGMAGQHKTARAAAKGSDQVEFSGHARHFQDFHGKPEGFEPFCQGSHHRLVTMIPFCRRAAD